MIKIFTLNNGDDIIAEMLNEDEEHVILKDPLTIKYAISMKGGMYVQLRMYNIFSADDIFSFKKSAIVSVSYPRANMAEYYQLSVDTAKKEFIPDVDMMVDEYVTALKSYQMDRQVAETTEAAFTDFLQKVTLKTMQ
jgi:hypothetical protein